MEDLFIETEFGTVFGKSAGQQGDPLVLGIHGYSQRNGWQTWQPMMAPLAEAGCWVVSLDMPGWGRSVAQRPFDNSDYVAVIMAILDSLEVNGEITFRKS